ncbi:hypothetical protein [Microbacterium galbinum]|uniref:hypothetical protein n=1 Tax=Microbacterium galbinum TaxID=2851646 RepID=UPI001FFC5455|nr:hypothetical protein [Microbacterium galbinum]MCK2029543.1 hypothetical protein [Microbacterium galbinum]
MRSVNPIPGNPWPHDMVIRIEDRPSTLQELLWLREAYSLHPAGDDLPPLLVRTPAPAATVLDQETRTQWASVWSGLWHEASAHAGREQDRDEVARLLTMAPGDPDRAGLLHEIVGPTWRDEMGDEAFDDQSYDDWQQRSTDEHVAGRPDALKNSPEHRDLEALIPAWRAGLTTIITIPCQGEHTRRVGDNALLVTAGTRADSVAYRRALSSFT